MATPVNVGGTIYQGGPYSVLVVEPAPGVKLQYWIHGDFPAVGAGVFNTGSEQNLRNALAGIPIAGTTEELVPISRDWGNYKNFWNNLLDQTLGPSNPARNDPSVLGVIAKFASRPDMSSAELKNLLRATPYFQQLTEKEREWNDLGAAEKGMRQQAVAAQLQEAYFELVGTHAPDAEVQKYAGIIASGKRSFDAIKADWIQSDAQKNPESPWMRTRRAEQENQRRRPWEIEQKQGELRGLLSRWGVQMDPGELGKWAQDMVELRVSDDDLLEHVKDLAQVLYPWKDREMETTTAAQPWIQTYNRVLEKQGGLMDPKIQEALQQGLPVFEFEKQLKQSPEWEQTTNFNESMTQSLGDVARRMGFST